LFEILEVDAPRRQRVAIKPQHRAYRLQLNGGRISERHKATLFPPRLFLKFEIRISKSETIFQIQKDSKESTKPQSEFEFVWNIWSFDHLILFRVSDFVLRIYRLSLGALLPLFARHLFLSMDYFAYFAFFAVNFLVHSGKIVATTSSRPCCTWGSSVIPQVIATWQARRGAMPSLINRPAYISTRVLAPSLIPCSRRFRTL
jgi:hypothetical protein